MKKIEWLFVWALCLMSTTLSAQTADTLVTQDSSGLVMDAIRFEAIGYAIDSATNTAIVTLTLTCLSERSRELKVNVYGTQLVDDQRNAYYFSTLTMGRVLMRFEDRLNYLHYLLQPGAPATLTITAQNVSPEASAIQVVKVVFEDSKDEGRFLEAYLPAPATE